MGCLVNYFSINKCLKLSVKTVVNFLFSLMACLLQMTVEKDQGFLHRLKPSSHYLVICDFPFQGFLYEFEFLWNCWMCHLLSWSVTVCLPVCLRNTCKTNYTPQSLSSTLCFAQKKKKAAFYHDSCFILLFDSVTFFSVIYSVFFFICLRLYAIYVPAHS